jgi:hypothetical protein
MSWIKMTAQDGYLKFSCDGCGCQLVHTMPIGVSFASKLGDIFSREHSVCDPRNLKHRESAHGKDC